MSAPAPSPQPIAHVSRTCAAGNHTRCLGTVYTSDGLTTCACSVPDCGHGTDTAKAKARR